MQAIAVARKFLAEDDIDILCQPAFREGCSSFPPSMPSHFRSPGNLTLFRFMCIPDWTSPCLGGSDHRWTFSGVESSRNFSSIPKSTASALQTVSRVSQPTFSCVAPLLHCIARCGILLTFLGFATHNVKHTLCGLACSIQNPFNLLANKKLFSDLLIHQSSMKACTLPPIPLTLYVLAFYPFRQWFSAKGQGASETGRLGCRNAPSSREHDSAGCHQHGRTAWDVNLGM